MDALKRKRLTVAGGHSSEWQNGRWIGVGWILIWNIGLE